MVIFSFDGPHGPLPRCRALGAPNGNAENGVDPAATAVRQDGGGGKLRQVAYCPVEYIVCASRRATQFVLAPSGQGLGSV